MVVVLVVFATVAGTGTTAVMVVLLMVRKVLNNTRRTQLLGYCSTSPNSPHAPSPTPIPTTTTTHPLLLRPGRVSQTLISNRQQDLAAAMLITQHHAPAKDFNSQSSRCGVVLSLFNQYPPAFHSLLPVPHLSPNLSVPPPLHPAPQNKLPQSKLS